MLDLVILLHIAVAVLAQLVAILATCLSTFFLVKQRSLRAKNFDALLNSRVSLEILDLIFTRLLLLGFLFISIALVSGFFLYFFLPSKIRFLEYKMAWAVLVWVWYAFSLLFRHKILKSRTVSAQMCSLGFLILLSTCFGFIF